MSAAIYARISQDSAQEGLGVARQVAACAELAKRRGWTVKDRYVDNDVSATRTKPRPEYERLLADIESGAVSAVVVYALDRLTRRPAELESFIALAERQNVELANVTGDVDLSTANGRMIARMLGALARGEAERMGERIKAEQLQRAKRGLKHQGKYRTLGFERDGTMVESEAAVVREVFRRKAAGESLTAIATDLNGRGVHTTGGGVWDASAVGKLIRRRDYVGEIAIKGEVVGTSAFPALVDRPTFDLANELLEASSRRGKNARVGLLSGFLVCGVCLTKMKRGGTKDGPNYRCPGKAVPGACGGVVVSARWTDEYVFNAVWRRAQVEPQAGPVVDRDWRAEEQAIEAERIEARALYDSKRLTLTDLVPVLDTLSKRQAALQREEAAAVRREPTLLETMFSFGEGGSRNLSEQRAWLDSYLSYVLVKRSLNKPGSKTFNPERLEVHYEDGTAETLTAGKLVLSVGRTEKVAAQCLEPSCDKTVYSKGRCATHYKSHWRKNRSQK